MTITSHLFEAHLKCLTKCWLRSAGEPTAGHAYAEWVQTQNESYRRDGTKRLMETTPEAEYAIAPVSTNFKTAQWRIAADVPSRTELRSSRGNEAQTSATENDQSLLTSAATFVESSLHAVERIPSEGRGKVAQFTPIRFTFTNKLSKDDKLLLAFDAFVLSKMLGREVSLGRIIHGDGHSTLKVKTSALASEVRKRIEKIAMLLSNPEQPDLVLNRHCAECEFQARCRKIAIEKDDLSLLAGMSAKERQKLRSKGIFTVTQLSYTFRPRRRPKRLRDKREKYHHALKALAIREKKIHIVGSPELTIEGTPVYLDVEGLPDRDFYYLIGVRIGHGESAVQHSLWADTVAEEGKIWREFLGILETVEKPVLIHYGSYEPTFLKRMGESHGQPPEESAAAKATRSTVNLLSFVFSRIYFPTYSNGLKEVAGWFGFKWSEAKTSGTQAICWRSDWERLKDIPTRQKLIAYNAEDCSALQLVSDTTSHVCIKSNKESSTCGPKLEVVVADNVSASVSMWGHFSSPIPAFESINKAAQWDYQRDRIYVRTDKLVRAVVKNRLLRTTRAVRPNKEVICGRSQACPTCGKRGEIKYSRTRILFDLRFSKHGVRRWVVKYHLCSSWCPRCHRCFGNPKEFWRGSRYGCNVVALIVYMVTELCMTQKAVAPALNEMFSLGIHERTVHWLKATAAQFYEKTREQILAGMVGSRLIHGDETHVVLKGKSAYVWVFATLHEVAYFYAETREGDFLQKSLKGFGGVLVSDFYAAYDSVPCPQQKCLIHLMRDLNDTILANPYDEEVKTITSGFGDLLRGIVETTDRWGLKRHFLRKHHRNVDQFYRRLGKMDCQSEAALKCKERFQNNRDKLFTFLDYDGVPWNNNNAEHAIKAFARLRRAIVGLSTPKGIEEYLVLLSVCQTCKYMGVDFLDFLRSGEKDIHAFAESRRGRRRRAQTSQPTDLPANANPDSCGQS